MISNVHIVRNALICMSLWIALTVELTIFGAATFAQNYAPGFLPPPSAGSAGSVTVPSDSATPIPPNLPSEAADSTQMGTTAVPSDSSTTMQPRLPAKSRHRDPVEDQRDFVGGTRQWKGAAHSRLLCRIGKSPRLAGLSVELRRWRGIGDASQRIHAPRLPAAR